jgi:hypothetical protein
MSGAGACLYWPLSEERAALQALFAPDPLLSLPLLFSLFHCLRRFKDAAHLRRQITWARRGLCWALLYPLLCLGIQQGLTYKYNRDYTEVGTPAEKISLSPVLFSPLYWKAVAENKEEYRLSWVVSCKFSSRVRFGPPAYSKVPDELWAALSREAPIFDEYRKAAFFPFMEKGEEKNGVREYSFKDLRLLYSVPNFIAALPLWSGPPPGLQARLDAEGRLLAWRHIIENGPPAPWTEARPEK